MQKLFHLERNMAFMREQHRQMLAALQEEVDTLKRRNQGRNYKYNRSGSGREEIQINVVKGCVK